LIPLKNKSRISAAFVFCVVIPAQNEAGTGLVRQTLAVTIDACLHRCLLQAEIQGLLSVIGMALKSAARSKTGFPPARELTTIDSG